MKDTSRASSAAPVALPLRARGVRHDRVRGRRRPAARRTPRTSRVPRRTRAPGRASSVSSSAAHSVGVGPTQPMSASKSRGSTPPPGNTHMPAAKAMSTCRRSRYTSSPPGAPSPRAAVRPSRRPRLDGLTRCPGEGPGVLGEVRGQPAGAGPPALRPRRSARPRPARRAAARTPTALRACLPASPKTVPISSLGAVGHAGLTGEVRCRRDERDDLDHPVDRGQLADLGLTAARAFSAHCWAHSTASSGLTPPPTLPV